MQPSSAVNGPTPKTPRSSMTSIPWMTACTARGQGTRADMESAIAAARGASTCKALPHEQERWLLRVAELMEERQKDLVDCLIDEIGSPVQKAMFEFNRPDHGARCRRTVPLRAGETIPSDAPGKFSMSVRDPLACCRDHAVQRPADQDHAVGLQCAGGGKHGGTPALRNGADPAVRPDRG